MQFISKVYSENEKTITDKDKALNSEMTYMLCRLMAMFKYDNLPETIPATELELALMVYGKCFVTEHNGKLYALTGNMFGVNDEYDNPTRFGVINAALNLSRDYDIKREGVLIKNDTFAFGVLPLLSKYCTLLVENAISLRQSIINSRAISIISASDDKTKASADLFLKKLEHGELSAIGETALFEGIKSYDVSSANSLRQLMEIEQYLRASMFHSLGIDYTQNIKRTVITSYEAELNDDYLLPLVDNFKACRVEGIKNVNSKYGTNITVDFDSIWKTNQLENDAEQHIFLDAANNGGTTKNTTISK